MTTLHATLQLPNLPFLVFCQLPNPATNAVTIAINPGLAEVEREVQVRTAQGKLVGSSAVPMGTWRHRVGTEAIPAGLYFFTVVENGRTVHAEKVTIIK